MSTPAKSVVSPDPIILQKTVAGVGAVFSTSVLDVSAKFAAQIAWDFAPLAVTATPAATVFQILGASNLASGVVDSADDAWEVIQDWLSPTAASTQFTAVAGTLGASTFTIASGSPAFYADHFIQGASDNEAGCEWVVPIQVSGTTVTIRGTLKNTYAGALLWSGAQKSRFDIDLSNVGKIKFMIGNNRGTDRDVANRVRVLSLDSIA